MVQVKIVNARSLRDFFHSSHNFSLFFIGGGGGRHYTQISQRYMEGTNTGQVGPCFHYSYTLIEQIYPERKCELTFGLYRRYALQAVGYSCPSLSNVCNAGWTLQHKATVFLAQMFDTIRKDKMSKIYTLYELLIVEKFKSMVRTSWYQKKLA